MKGSTGSCNDGDLNVLCNCGIRAPLRATRAGINAGRRFYGYLNYKTKFACGFFIWVDPPNSESTQNLQIRNSELQRKIDELESRVEVLEAMKGKMHKEVQQMDKQVQEMQQKMETESWWKKIGFLFIVFFGIAYMYKKMETEKYPALA